MFSLDFSFFRSGFEAYMLVGSTRMGPGERLSADLAEVPRFLITDWPPGLTVVSIRFVRLDLTRQFYVVVAGGTITHWLLG